MKYTANYNLKKPEGTDTVNIDDLNNNADILDTEINSINEQIDTLTIQDNSFREQINNLGAYAVASGTNTYTATISGIISLTEGQSVKIKFTNANTGASTLSINSLGAKNIVKGNGSALASGNIKTGQICNLVYTGSNFQLLGEGGEYGTATASDVLSGKTIGTEEGLIDGIMSNRGAVNQNLTSEGQEYTIQAGYHNGLGKIKAVINGLVASVIKAGTTVGGILGTFTSDATAVDVDVLSGKTYYRNGIKGTGSMVDRGTVNQALATQGQEYTILAGKHSGSGKVTANFANLTAGNVKDGVNIGGVVGNYDNSGISKIFETSLDSTEPVTYGWNLRGHEIGYTSSRSVPVITDAVLFLVYSANTSDYSVTSSAPVLMRKLSETSKAFYGQLTTFMEYATTGSNMESLLVYNPDRHVCTINKTTGGSLNVNVSAFIL
nr:phage tail protein [Sedimentibacter sp.]